MKASPGVIGFVIAALVPMLAAGLSGCTIAPNQDLAGQYAEREVVAFNRTYVPLSHFSDFREPAEEIAYWYGTINGSYDELTGGCRELTTELFLDYSVIKMMNAVTGACLFIDPVIEEVRAQVKMNNDTGPLEGLRAETRDAVNRTQELLSSDYGYSNISSVQVLAWMMSEFLGGWAFLERVDSQWSEEVAVDAEEAEGYAASYATINSTMNALQRLHLIFRTEPPRCDGTHEDLFVDVSSRVEMAAARYAPYANDERVYVRGLNEFLSVGLPERLAFAAEHDWWPYAYNAKIVVPMYEHVLVQIEENVTAPDYEAAVEFWTEKAVEPRSLATDALLESRAPQHSTFSWPDNEHAVRWLLSLDAMKWSYGDVDCSG